MERIMEAMYIYIYGNGKDNGNYYIVFGFGFVSADIVSRFVTPLTAV